MRSPDDLKGQKIRVMASPVMVNTMEAMGATGVPVAWAELYTALQTGVVDGAENNHPSVVAKKFYEVSKFYSLDEHMRIPDLLLVSMKLWNQLNDEQKKALEEAGHSAQAYMRGAWKISELKDLQQLKSNFTEIITPDKAPFVKSVSGLVRIGGEAARGREDGRLHPRQPEELLTATEAVHERGRRGNRRPSHVGRGRLALLALLDRFVDGLVAIVRLVCIVLATALFVIVVAAIVARYGFGRAVSWTEEVPRYLLIWVSFLGAAVGVVKREHVGFECCSIPCRRACAGRWRSSSACSSSASAGSCCATASSSSQDFGSDLMETIPFTNYWYYPAMPVSGFLIMVFAFKLIVDEIVRPSRRRHHRPDRGLAPMILALLGLPSSSSSRSACRSRLRSASRRSSRRCCCPASTTRRSSSAC